MVAERFAVVAVAGRAVVLVVVGAVEVVEVVSNRTASGTVVVDVLVEVPSVLTTRSGGSSERSGQPAMPTPSAAPSTSRATVAHRSRPMTLHRSEPSAGRPNFRSPAVP